MTLVKTKRTVSSSKRKMLGEHHRKSQKYLKPYWPYLPLILILGGGLLANNYLPASFNKQLANGSGSARIDSLVGGNSKILISALSFVLLALIIWFVIRHFKRLRKLAVEGEQILARSFTLDVIVGMAISVLYILLR